MKKARYEISMAQARAIIEPYREDILRGWFSMNGCNIDNHPGYRLVIDGGIKHLRDREAEYQDWCASYKRGWNKTAPNEDILRVERGVTIYKDGIGWATFTYEIAIKYLLFALKPHRMKLPKGAARTTHFCPECGVVESQGFYIPKVGHFGEGASWHMPHAYLFGGRKEY
jgi:hypothetical protein